MKYVRDSGLLCLLLRKITGFRPKSAAGMTNAEVAQPFHGFRVSHGDMRYCLEGGRRPELASIKNTGIRAGLRG